MRSCSSRRDRRDRYAQTACSIKRNWHLPPERSARKIADLPLACSPDLILVVSFYSTAQRPRSKRA